MTDVNPRYAAKIPLRTYAVRLVCLSLVYAAFGCGAAPESGAQATRASVVKECPVFIEWTCFDERGVSTNPPLPNDTPVVWVDEKGTLVGGPSAATETGEARSLFERLEMIRGYPCAVVNSGHAPSNLDAIVSADLDDVSAWQAIKTVSRQIHCELLYGEDMAVAVIAHMGIHPPPVFYRSEDITVHLHGVTAREALCEILRQSSIPIGIRYRAVFKPIYGMEKGTSFFDVRFFRDGKQIEVPRDLPKPPDSPDFTLECEEAQQPEEDCAQIAEANQRE